MQKERIVQTDFQAGHRLKGGLLLRNGSARTLYSPPLICSVSSSSFSPLSPCAAYQMPSEQGYSLKQMSEFETCSFAWSCHSTLRKLTMHNVRIVAIYTFNLPEGSKTGADNLWPNDHMPDREHHEKPFG